jgi:hypothetical protein
MFGYEHDNVLYQFVRGFEESWGDTSDSGGKLSFAGCGAKLRAAKASWVLVSVLSCERIMFLDTNRLK